MWVCKALVYQVYGADAFQAPSILPTCVPFKTVRGPLGLPFIRTRCSAIFPFFKANMRKAT